MKKVIIKIAKSNDEFVGLYTKNDTMTITFPIGYALKEKTIILNEEGILELSMYRKDIFALLKTLEVRYDNPLLGEGIYPFSFSLGIKLIDDYLANGLIKEYTNKTNIRTDGQINWHKTITNLTPIYNKNNFIYLNYIANNNELNINEVSLIQMVCLQYCFRVLGMFYNNYNIKIAVNMSKEEMLNKLYRALFNTNVDHVKKVITMLIIFLKGTDINNIGEKEIKVGTDNFNIIWENVLRHKILQQYDQIDIKPKAYYLINNEEILASSLIPDIIVQDKKKILIIDAKYYKVNTYPQTWDIAKQLVYGNYIKNKTSKEIVNVFLLPNNIKENYEFLGYGCMEGFNDVIEVYLYSDTYSINHIKNAF